MSGVTDQLGILTEAGSPEVETARRAIVETVRSSCGAPLAEGITIQAKHSGGFVRVARARR